MGQELVGTEPARLSPSERRIYENTPYEDCPNSGETKYRPLGYSSGWFIRKAKSMGTRCKACKYEDEADWKPEPESLLTALSIDAHYQFKRLLPW